MTNQRLAQTRPTESGVRRAPILAASGRKPEHPILRLQRTIGNRAVQRLIEPQSADTEAAPGHGEGMSTVFPVSDIVNSGLGSPGQPLDTDIRSFMEDRFGFDFGSVRVHTDPMAADSSEAINATAYTVGQDIVFGAGKYSPGSTEGKQLIAHELTHVVQQPEVSSTSGELNVTNPWDQSEQDAEQVADEVMSESPTVGDNGQLTTNVAQTGASVHRDDAQGDDDSVWSNLTGPIISGAGKLVDVGVEAAEGLGPLVPGVGGLAAGGMGVIEGGQEGGALGGLKATGGGLEILGGVGDAAIAGGAAETGAAGLLADAGPVGMALGAGLAGGGLMEKVADSDLTRTGAFGTNTDTGQNQSAMDWGANWGTAWDKAHNQGEASITGGILAGAGGIVGGIGGALYGAANWLGQNNDDHN